MKFRPILINAALVLVSATLSLVGLEIIYRVYIFNTLYAQLVEPMVSLAERQPTSEINSFDPQLGYRYPATRFGATPAAFKNEFRINERGLIANDSTVGLSGREARGEFRIALWATSPHPSPAMSAGPPLQDFLNRPRRGAPSWATGYAGDQLAMDGPGSRNGRPASSTCSNTGSMIVSRSRKTSCDVHHRGRTTLRRRRSAPHSFARVDTVIRQPALVRPRGGRGDAWELSRTGASAHGALAWP